MKQPRREAYYNEIDPFAAQVLRQLIDAGHIARGVVDERSIVDVKPDELLPYAQCHFFAGFGVWSYSLRKAGWGDNRPVWTGSCPCQPFSAAGKGTGFDDERHLWPHFHWLISKCLPDTVFGEQVASKDGLAWLDLVQADLEGSGYTSGAVDLCAAGVGAPNIRQRLWWFAEQGVGQADAYHPRLEGRIVYPERSGELSIGQSSLAGRMADTNQDGREQGDRVQSIWGEHNFEYGGGALGMADARGRRGKTGLPEPKQWQEGNSGEYDNGSGERDGRQASFATSPTRPTYSFWGNPDWLFCRDGKWRPVEPGTFPLAHGAPARVGRLRGYGNAINAKAATAFIEAYLELKSENSM